jgi:hypothetical protein
MSALAIGLAGGVLIGCQALAPSDASPSPSIQGAPLDVTAPLGPAECRVLIARAMETALAIREYVHIDGLGTTAAAVRAAASDPTATLFDLGIPLTSAERRLVAGSGQSFRGNAPLLLWVHVGAPGRFGGIWLDPPGSDRWVVSIPDGSPGTLAMAQCLQGIRQLPTRYVRTALSYQGGMELQARVLADRELWAASGILVLTSSFAEDRGVVQVGVRNPTNTVIAALRDRYGENIDVVRT